MALKLGQVMHAADLIITAMRVSVMDPARQREIEFELHGLEAGKAVSFKSKVVPEYLSDEKALKGLISVLLPGEVIVEEQIGQAEKPIYRERLGGCTNEHSNRLLAIACSLLEALIDQERRIYAEERFAGAAAMVEGKFAIPGPTAGGSPDPIATGRHSSGALHHPGAAGLSRDPSRR